MDIEQSMSNRKNTYNWTDQIPSQSDIDKIVHDIHNYAPSKSRRVRFVLTVIKNDDITRKNLIYKSTITDPSKPNARFNPQVLAPYLLSFTKRDPDTIDTDPDSYDDYLLDIGIASAYAVLSASSLGLDTGFCKCFNDTDSLFLAINDIPTLLIGIGYRSKDKKYLCPIRNTITFIPDRDYDTKPDIQEYVRYV